MKLFCGCVLSVATCVYSQTATLSTAPAPSNPTIKDFGLVYPLSSDWVRATELLRKKLEKENSQQNFDVLLAAVYVPNSNISSSSPFFSLFATRQLGADCRKSLEAAIAQSQDKKERFEGGVVEFSAAGRNYFRINMAHGLLGRHERMICTQANGHLLVWNAGASNEKGLDAIVSTLNSVSALPAGSPVEDAPTTPKQDGAESSTQPVSARPTYVRVASGITTGLKIKDARPVYPSDARANYIQGTVVLKAEISKEGNITDLELLDGPIELAGSAVAAVRQWKYKPYMLNGQPVAIQTQIQVNYVLSR